MKKYIDTPNVMFTILLVLTCIVQLNQLNQLNQFLILLANNYGVFLFSKIQYLPVSQEKDD